MVGKNVYKPRYKIAFQSKSKIWPYKDSRLRRFFNIRGRKIIRSGKSKRYFMVFNNMKWTIARRFIKPYMLKRRPVHKSLRYRILFYKKQQIRHFYGKISEEVFRNFFRKFLANSTNRNKTFFSSLELRLDMVIFRMRIMPTIFACHQLIHHHGVFVNNQLKNAPQEVIRVGDLIHLSKKQWDVFFLFLNMTVYFKDFGSYTLFRRKHRRFKKKLYFLKRYVKFQYLKVFSVFTKQNKIASTLKIFNKFCVFFLNRFSKQIYNCYNRLENNAYKKYLQVHFLIPLRLIKKDLKRSLTYFTKKSTTFFYLMWRRKLFKWRRYKKIFIKWFRFFFFYLKFINKMSFRLKSYELKFLKYKYITLFSDNKDSQYFVNDLNNFYMSLNNIQNTNLFPTKISCIRKFLELRKSILFGVYNLIEKQIRHFVKFFIIFRVNKKPLALSKKISIIDSTKNNEEFMQSLKNKMKFKRRGRMFFMVWFKYKKRRRRQIHRLKKLHIYIPSYIFFDFYTLRGVVIYSPKSNEIHHTFKSSLRDVSSFYKSKGY